MSTALRRLNRLSGLVIGLLCCAMLGLSPGLPLSAADEDVQDVDDLQGQFADGVFQRTVLGTYKSPTIADDKAGIAQLAPIGVLSLWGVGENLRLPLGNTGLAALGDYLFTVTGEQTVGLGSGKSDKAYRALVNRENGQPIPFDTVSGQIWEEFTIPPAVASVLPDCVDQSTAARTRAGVVATESSSSGTLGYIYVIGGVVTLEACAEELTTPLVQIGTVNSSGEITGWVKAPNLPTPSGDTGFATIPLGVADPMVTIVRTSTNNRFLYVMGGYSTNPFATFGDPDTIYKAVFYARIDPATGGLRHPTTNSATDVWARAANIDMENDTKAGLRDGVAMGTSASRIDNSTNPPGVVITDGIFVAGGCHTPTGCTDNNDFVYRAIVNPDTGALTWSDRPSVGGSSLVGVDGRGGLGGIAYGSKLYLIGGSPNGTPAGALTSVPTAFFNDSLEVEQLGVGSDYFVGLTEQVLPAPRTNVGVAILPAKPPADEANKTLNSAWVYVAGGSDDTGIKDSLYIGKLGGEEEVLNPIRVRDGWYYSAPINVTVSGRLARVLSVRWSADIDRALNTQADIHVEFRKTITADGLCDLEDFKNTTADRWREMDGDTDTAFRTKSNTAEDPFNIVQMETLFPTESVDATCFQYRARFLQNGQITGVASPDPTASPRLLRFSVERVLAAAADLKLHELQVTTRSGRVVGSLVQIRNLNTRGLEFTLPADADEGGQFLVSLCVKRTPPGQTPIPMEMPATPSTPQNMPACGVAFTLIDKAALQSGTVFTISKWKRNDTQAQINDIRELFVEPGNYQVGLVIDYWDYVREGNDGEQNNRGEAEGFPNGRNITFDVTAPPQYLMIMPIINR